MTSIVKTRGGFRAQILALMSYLGILCFVPLLRNRDDEFVNFHAKQGLIIWIIGVFGVFALHLPGIGKWLFSVIAFAVLAYSAVGIISALLNRAWKLPFVHPVSTRI